MSKERWSPLGCLPRASLTPSGLLELDTAEGEVEVLTRDTIELRIPEALPRFVDEDKSEDAKARAPVSEKWVDRDSNLVCILTTHRLVFVQPSMQQASAKKKQKQEGSYIDLCLVNGASSAGGHGFSFSSSSKIKLITFAYGEVLIVFGRGSQDRDQMLSSLSKCLSRKAWLESTRSKQKNKSKASTKVGVDAIMAKNKERHEDAKRISEEAFGSDVEGLMSEARDLVKVINKYVATLEKKRRIEDQNSSTSSKSTDDDEEKLSEMLRSMGMMTAVTKASAGNLYHQQLARQLSDFLQQSDRLNRAGGMMTLTDVYCLFNRARGTNLISPDDMLEGVQLLKELGLGFSKREFPSGVIVVQSDEHDDAVMARKLCDLAATKTDASVANGTVGGSGTTAMIISREFKISAVLALEQLQSAERMGYLCRDTTLEGVRFFPNLFASSKWGSYWK